MYTGTIKFFNEAKGFGFIVDTASKQEIFVHSSGLVDKVKNSDMVTFETKRGRKGLTDVNVRVS